MTFEHADDIHEQILLKNSWLVPFCVNYTEKAKGFFKRISQLMGSVGLYIEGIEKSNLILLIADNTKPVSSDTYDNVFVFVHFEAAITVGCDFEIS